MIRKPGPSGERLHLSRQRHSSGSSIPYFMRIYGLGLQWDDVKSTALPPAPTRVTHSCRKHTVYLPTEDLAGRSSSRCPSRPRSSRSFRAIPSFRLPGGPEETHSWFRHFGIIPARTPMTQIPQESLERLICSTCTRCSGRRVGVSGLETAPRHWAAGNGFDHSGGVRRFTASVLQPERSFSEFARTRSSSRRERRSRRFFRRSPLRTPEPSYRDNFGGIGE